MSADSRSFPDSFFLLTGHSPMRWQHRLFDQFIDGKIPAALDLPTGVGKTSVMAIWILARALAREEALKTIPLRLVFVVDRRAVVDQATAEGALSYPQVPRARRRTGGAQGQVLVHNHVIPQPRIGMNWFRAWTQLLTNELVLCTCDWAGQDLHGRPHYRVNLGKKDDQDASKD
jgi:hypothetical protein